MWHLSQCVEEKLFKAALCNFQPVEGADPSLCDWTVSSAAQVLEKQDHFSIFCRNKDLDRYFPVQLRQT